MRADREYVATTTLSYRKNDSVNDDYKSLATVEVTSSGPSLREVVDSHGLAITSVYAALNMQAEGILEAEKAVEPPSFD